MLTAEEKTFKVALISRKLLETIKNSLLVLKSTFLENIRIDRYLLIFVVLYGALVFPTIFYGIQNAKLQDLVANDEPMITMELDGMTVYPYGNPANYLNPENVEKMKLPDYWYDFTYYGLPYYGGVYLDLAFMGDAPEELSHEHEADLPAHIRKSVNESKSSLDGPSPIVDRALEVLSKHRK